MYQKSSVMILQNVSHSILLETLKHKDVSSFNLIFHFFVFCLLFYVNMFPFWILYFYSILFLTILSLTYKRIKRINLFSMLGEKTNYFGILLIFTCLIVFYR